MTFSETQIQDGFKPADQVVAEVRETYRTRGAATAWHVLQADVHAEVDYVRRNEPEARAPYTTARYWKSITDKLINDKELPRMFVDMQQAARNEARQDESALPNNVATGVAPNNGADAGPKLSPGKHTFKLPNGRKYDVYVPDGLSYPAAPMVAADGVVTVDKDPSTQWRINGVYAEADRDQNHVVVTLHPVKQWSPLLGLFGTVKGWNYPNSPTGYDADGPDDTEYFFDTVTTDLPRRIRVDLSKTACEGLSSGGTYLQAMNEDRSGLPKEPVCKSITFFSSGVQDDEPKTKSGISEAYIFAQDSGQHPDGGLALSTKEGWFFGLFGLDSRAGWIAKSFDIFVPSSRLEHNVPNLLLRNEMEVNHMDLAQAQVTHGHYYDRTTYRSPDGKTMAIKYDVKPPYTGHYVAGSSTAAAGNPTPPEVLSGAHVAACVAGLGTHCESDSVPK